MTDILFSPSFGNKPRVLVGRDLVMQTLVEGLASYPGSKERARLIIGQRGLGKTVLLLELAEIAKEQGFIVASPTVVSGDMLVRILEKLCRSGENILPHEKTRITGGSIGILGFSAGIQTDNGDHSGKSFAYQLQTLCERARDAGKGILILIDEVQSGNEELKKLIIAYQEMVGEEHNIAMVMAGLPSAVSQTLNQHVLTFLNRASKLHLEPISIREIEIYYRNCFEHLGIVLNEEQIRQAAKHTEGSPYMMQLIGHYITITASERGTVAGKDFETALSLARMEFIEDICETTLAQLSEKDIAFLSAMSDDENESSMQDICKRLEVDSSYANRYRSRLLQAGVINQSRRGFVTFAVPYLRDYLLANR